MKNSAKIEAILFYKGEPVSFTELSKILSIPEPEIIIGLNELELELQNGGLVLLRDGNFASLGTKPEVSKIIEDVRKEELSRELGKAGLETLSVILYKGAVSRKEIEFIRGVNCNFILRNLLIRGLIEKVQSPNEKKSFVYKPTVELFAFLGISKNEDLPEFAKYQEEIKKFEEGSKEIKNDEENFEEEKNPEVKNSDDSI